MPELVAWKPAYRDGEATISKLLALQPELDQARIELEDGKTRWIPAHWIEEEA